MVLASELELPYLAMEDRSFALDPFPQVAAARRQHPWLARCFVGYIVHEYRAIRELMLLEDSMRMPHAGIVENMGAGGTPWGNFIEESMQAQSGEVHTRLRTILAPAFTPRQANRHRALMREVIATLLDEWAPKGAFDFEEFASYFPITVFCSIIGASPDAIPSLRSSMEAIGLGFSMDRALLPRLQNATIVMQEFVEALVAERRLEPRSGDDSDLLDVLLEASGEGGLTDAELYNLLIFLFVAGYDTSKNVLTLIMNLMVDRPEDYIRCAQDPGFCRKVVDEAIRYYSPASSGRILTEDLVFRDVLFPRDTMLYFPWSLVGRDPGAVENPDEFEPERRQHNPHMAFGLGPRICIGQHLARAQIEEGLHLIAQRLTHPRSPGPNDWRPFPGVWGIRGLPIEFEPAEAVPA